MDIGSFRQIKPQKLSEDELERLAGLDSNLVNQLAVWANRQLTCSHCKRCTLRCEVLKGPGLDIGLIEEHYERIQALPPENRPDAVIELVQEKPEFFISLRQCCFCGYCTASCQHHVLAPDRMREWRELFMQAGYMPPDDSKLVMVDNEWHIFSAYRAIYGIAYPEFLSLESAAEKGPGYVDTLFFPGCSLVSYTPELMRKVGAWLSHKGITWALSDDCCGSPLMSAGLFDRAEALRQKILDQAHAAGITRIVTVCPGCGEELAEMMDENIDIVPLPELLLESSAPEFSLSEAPSSATFFDSCHDRLDNRHATAIRKLMKAHFSETEQREMDYRRKGTLCCGAGGAVGSYDPDITDRRVWRIIDEAQKTQAETLITMCPTCTYTIGQALIGAPDTCSMKSHHYLELLFDEKTDWAQIFAQLESMWSGEYGPWLNETFFS